MATDANTEFAPAKINLCLHITGRRFDGYHLLDSLVVFAGVGDRIGVAKGRGLTLTVAGPEAQDLAATDDNLVLRAARAVAAKDLEFSLWKVLPVASGIGGGSADAAAALRLLARRAGYPVPDAAAALALGADVPACLSGRPVRGGGVGDALSPLPPLPPMACLLVNPRVPVPTAQVFAGLVDRQNPAVPDLPVEALRSAASLAAWLGHHSRNDMVAAARAIAPVLIEVQLALESLSGCLLARMSGSGGTHFGIFPSLAAARRAEGALRTASPGWWTAATEVQAAGATAD